MPTTLLLGLTRAPKVLLLASVALTFGISGRTDAFWFLYAVATYLMSWASFSNEMMAPSRKTLSVSLAAALLVMGAAALFSPAPYAWGFLPLIALNVTASTLTGLGNRQSKYGVLGMSVLPYLLGIPPILFLRDLNTVVWILAGTELVRLLVALPNLRYLHSLTFRWDYSLGILAAVALAGSYPLIDNLYASWLAPGSVTILALAYGAITPLSNALTYGSELVKINRLSARVTLIPAFLGVGAVSLGSAGLYFFAPDWLSLLAIPVAILAWALPLSVAHTLQRAYLVNWQEWRPIVAVGLIMLAGNIALNTALLLLGLAGLTMATVLTLALALIYVTGGVHRRKMVYSTKGAPVGVEG